AELLIGSLNQIPTPRQPQPVGAIYPIATMPQRKDRLIPTSWSARRAFNFIRGADEWGPFEIDVNGKRMKVREALNFTFGERMDEAIQEKGGEIKIQFADGVVVVRFY
ncbi:MAG: hypothetical protein AAB261_02390, partial [Chloroflexota bacterium]